MTGIFQYYILNLSTKAQGVTLDISICGHILSNYFIKIICTKYSIVNVYSSE